MSQTEQLNNQEQEKNNNFPQDRQEITKFWERINSNPNNKLIFTSVLNTLPKMADYKADKEGILKNTYQDTTKLKTSFQV